MPSPKIFISYSRANKLYVSSLVTALRQEGFDVWFDKNIKTGEEWDNSIEREIKEADAMVLILSKTSVASDNVKDEMSYAMNLGKPLNPIKIEDCDVPMRLARKQYLDFTKLGHENGFNKLVTDLKSALDISKLEGTTSEKTVFAPSIDPEAAAPEAGPAVTTTQKPSRVSDTPQSSQTSKDGSNKIPKVPLLIGGVALLLVLAFLGYSSLNDEGVENNMDDVAPGINLNKASIEADQKDFNAAASTQSIESYQKYINKYPQGLFLERASDSIEKLVKVKDRADSIARIEKRAKDWLLTQEKNTLDDYIVFIKTYESGKEVEAAKKMRATLETNRENEKRDNELWQSIEQNPSVTRYLDYYTDSSIDGIHKDEVFKNVDSIGKKGYLFYGRSSNDSLSTSSVFDVICCAEGTVNHNKKPSKNDILLIERSVFTYYDSKRNRRTGTALTPGNKALVTDVTMEGNTAVIVQVIY